MKKSMVIMALGIILAIFNFSPVVGVGAENSSDIYVSNAAQPGGDGSMERPYKEISAAVEKAAELDKDQDITIHIAEGQYDIYEPISLSEEHSVNDGYTLRFISETADFSKEKIGGARIVGGERIDNDKFQTVNQSDSPYKDDIPVEYRDQIYVAQLDASKGAFYTLYEKGERMDVARTPNRNSELTNSRGPYFHTAYRDNFVMYDPSEFDADLLITKRVDGVKQGLESIFGELQTYIWADTGNHAWTAGTGEITYLDPAEAKFQQNAGGSGTAGTSSGYPNRFIIQNNLGLLDTEGEWFYDKDDGRLYIWPRNDINESQIIVPRAQQFITADGVQNITFEGFVFACTDTKIPFKSSWDQEREGQYYGAVDIRNSDNINILNCNMRQIGMSALMLQDANNSTIRGCLVENIALSGIVVIGENDLIESCRVKNPCELNPNFNGVNICDSYMTVARNLEISGSSRYALGFGGTSYAHQETADYFRGESKGSRLIMQYIKMMENAQDSGDTAPLYTVGAGNGYNVVDQLLSINNHADPSVLDRAPGGIYDDRDGANTFYKNVMTWDNALPAYREDPDRVENRFENVSWLYEWRKEKWAIDNIDEDGNCIDPNYTADIDLDGKPDAPLENFKPFTLYVNNETGKVTNEVPSGTTTVELNENRDKATVKAGENIDNASLIIAGYDNGILKTIDIKNITLKNGETGVFPVDIENTETVKTMLWNSIEGMQPLDNIANDTNYTAYDLGVVAIQGFYRSDNTKSHSNTGTVYDETAEPIKFDVEKIEMNKIGLNEKFPTEFLYNVDHVVEADDSKILYSSEDPWKIGTLDLWSDQGGELPACDEWILNEMEDKPYKQAQKDNAYTKFTTYGKQISWIGDLNGGSVKFYEIKDKYEFGEPVSGETELEIQPTNVIEREDGTTEYEFNIFDFSKSHTIMAIVSKGVKSYGFEYNENPEAISDPFEYEDRIQCVPSNKAIEVLGVDFIEDESSVSAENKIMYPEYEQVVDYYSAKDPLVKGIYSGAYLVYDVSEYDLSDITGVSIRMSNASSMTDLDSVYIDIRENNPYGRLLGSVKYTRSEATNRFRNTTASIKKISEGVTKLCLEVRSSSGAEMYLNNFLLLTSPTPTVIENNGSYTVTMNVKDYQTRPNYSKGKLITALIQNGEVQGATASLINEDLISPSTPVTFTSSIEGSGDLEILYYDTHQGVYAYRYSDGEVTQVDISESTIMKHIIYESDDGSIHIPFDLKSTNLTKGQIEEYNLNETEQVSLDWKDGILNNVYYTNFDPVKTVRIVSENFANKEISVTSMSDLQPVEFEANDNTVSFTAKQSEKYKVSVTPINTDEIKVEINGTPISMNNKVEIIGDVPMIPIGEIFTKLGNYSIIQYNEESRVMLRNIHIGNTELQDLPENKVWKNGDWYVPATYLEERFGTTRLTVDYANNILRIRYFENNPYSYYKGIQAKIGDVEYKTLNAAVVAAQEGDTVVVVGDYATLSSAPIKDNVRIVSDGDRTIKASYFDCKNKLIIGDGNSENGILTIDGNGGGRFVQASVTDGVIINSDVVVKNFNGDANGVIKSNGTVTIDGATFEDISGTGFNVGYQGQIYLKGNVKINSDMKAYIDAGKTGVINIDGTISGEGHIILDYSTHNTESYNLVTFNQKPDAEVLSRFINSGGTATQTPKAAFMYGDKFIGGAVVVDGNNLKLTAKKQIKVDDGISIIESECSPATSEKPFALGGDIAGDVVTFKVDSEILDAELPIIIIGAETETQYDFNETSEYGIYTFVMGSEAVEIRVNSEIETTEPEPIGTVLVNDILIKSGGAANKTNTLDIGGNISKKFDNTDGDNYLYLGDCIGSKINNIEIKFAMKQWFGVNNANTVDVGILLVPVGYTSITSDNIESKSTADNVIRLTNASFSQNENNTEPTALSSYIMNSDGSSELINPSDGLGISVVERGYTSGFESIEAGAKYHAVLYVEGGVTKRELFINTVTFN